MAFFFDVYGPFEIARQSDGTFVQSQADMWDVVETIEPGLQRAIGCYMFCLYNGDSVRPWYVGKTIAKGGFRAEVFERHKLDIYSECNSEFKGRPNLFFFPLMTNEGAERLSNNRSGGSTAISWLERTLMGIALQRNPDLWNIRDTTLPRSVTVRGILGAKRLGRPHSDVKEARRALFGE